MNHHKGQNHEGQHRMANTDGCSSTETKVYLIIQRTQVEIQEISDFVFSAEYY